MATAPVERHGEHQQLSAPYRDLLQKIRTAFPQPVSDRVHDSYFVHSIMRALDQVDALKSELPVLSQREPLGYADLAGAKLPEKMSRKSECRPAARFVGSAFQARMSKAGGLWPISQFDTT